MKKHILIALFAIPLAIGAYGQPNTYPYPEIGPLGIGTTSPDYKLHVVSSNQIDRIAIQGTLTNSNVGFMIKEQNGAQRWSIATTYDTDFLHFYRGSYGNVMVLRDNGNVGIGNASPSAKLQIHGNGAGTTALTIIENPNSASGAHFLSEGANNIKFQLRKTSDNSVNTELRTSGNSFINALSGNVGIGTTNPQSKLAVKGVITAQEVKVTMTGWSDYVFEEDYALIPLSELEEYIKENKHLPEVPTAQEVIQNGLKLGESDALLLKKIEELTLYIIEMEKRIKELENKTAKADQPTSAGK